MKRFLSFLVNPVLLPAIPALIIFILLPLKWERYLLEIEQVTILPEGSYHLYEDLTRDGNSEHIILTDIGHLVSVNVYDYHGVLYNQWNFIGNLDFSSRRDLLLFGDFNDDGLKELYFFTISADSILLHVINALENPEPALRNRLIARAGPGIGKPDPFIIKAEMDDLNGDGYKELIFGIGSGFSLYPRNVFAYYINSDSLATSPDSYYYLRFITQEDITGNGKREILLSGAATANVPPGDERFHDHSNWLMVLGQDLEFLFEPVELPGWAISLTTVMFPGSKGPVLAGLHTNTIVADTSAIFFFTKDGLITETVQFESKIRQTLLTECRKGETLLILADNDRNFLVYDENIVLQEIRPGINLSAFQQVDLDGDGKKEVMALDLPEGKFYVFRTDMSRCAHVDVNVLTGSDVVLSVRHTSEGQSSISLQVGQYHYIMGYGENTLFYLNFIWLVGIYSGMLLFTVAIQKIQVIKLKKREEVNKRIAELQINLVKNQVDQHFSLNALNAILYTLNSKGAQKASDYLLHFSGMFKNLLLTSKSICRSLKEELEFCRDYLELERLRFDERFDYNINVAEGVDTSRAIPKMSIHSHVENALKHGILHKKGKGKLDIGARIVRNNLVISIKDNGVGRAKTAQISSGSTGKGLEIMKEFNELYNKYHKTGISFEITDLFNSSGDPEGTEVVITISQPDQIAINTIDRKGEC